MVALRAQLQDRPAEEPELHAHLDQHRQVAEGQRLEGRDGGADVPAAAVLLGEAHPGLPGRGHLDHQLLDPLAVVLARERLGVGEDGGVRRQVAAHEVAHLGVAAVEQPGQGGHVDLAEEVEAPVGPSVGVTVSVATTSNIALRTRSFTPLAGGQSRETGTLEVVVVGCEASPPWSNFCPVARPAA